MVGKYQTRESPAASELAYLEWELIDEQTQEPRRENRRQWHIDSFDMLIDLHDGIEWMSRK